MNQRWRERRARYRPDGEFLDPKRYSVEPIERDTAKRFVLAHQYSGSFPATRLSVGLFRSRGDIFGPDLVGVAVFSVPMSQAVLPKWLGTDPMSGVELGRFVLLDDVEGNGETWFLARAFRALRREIPDVRGVLSFSDPVPSFNAETGAIVMPGHFGMIYQAFNGRYMGRANPTTLVLDRRGRVVSHRSLVKIRLQERGWERDAADFVARGAPPRAIGEDPAEWVRRARTSFRRVRHHGNHAYGWDFGGAVLRPEKPRPSKIDLFR